MLDRHKPQADARAGRLPLTTRGRLEPALVERVRDETAHLRMHPERTLEKQPAIHRDRLRIAEQMLQHRHTRTLRMDPLRHLRQLQRITEQNERARRRPHRQRIRQRYLARLVDEQVIERLVELRSREEPRRSRVQLNVDCWDDLVCALDELSFVRRFGIAAARLLQASERDAVLARGLLDRAQEIVDRLVARRRDTDSLAAHEQVHDQARARVRLARARRALYEQVTTFDLLDELLLLLQRRPLDAQ